MSIRRSGYNLEIMAGFKIGCFVSPTLVGSLLSGCSTVPLTCAGAKHLAPAESGNEAIANAKLTLHCNAQIVDAMANNFTNDLKMSAIDMDVKAAISASLVNRQGGMAIIDTLLGMIMFANVQSSVSAITLEATEDEPSLW